MEKIDHLDAKKKKSSASKLQSSLKQEVCSWSSCDMHVQVLKIACHIIHLVWIFWQNGWYHSIICLEWHEKTELHYMGSTFLFLLWFFHHKSILVSTCLCGPKPMSSSLKIRSFWSDIIHPSLATSDRQYWVVNIQCTSSVDCRLVQVFSFSVSPASSVLLYYFFFMTFDVYALQILQLEKRLQDQFAERRVLEKALGYGSSSHDNSNETLMPKVDSFIFLRLHFSTRIMQT